MITVKEKIRLIEACFGEARITNDNKNAVVFCPICKESGRDKRKLAIEIKNGVYHCWVCESKGKNIGRVALKYSIQKKSGTELYTYYKKDKVDDRHVREEQSKSIILPGDFRLIAGNRDITSRNGRSYLENRGFAEKDICRFRVGVSDKYLFKNRVIFPSFDSMQKLNYFTARTFDENIKKRYYNCRISRKDVIFREFDIDFSKELILVEGVFDLLHTPHNSTCILGSWLDKKYRLFQEIIKHKTPVILCFDYDAIAKTQKIAKALHEYCVPVKISYHNIGKDFGSMTKEEVDYFIKQSKPYDNVNRISYLIKGISSGSIF
jgi:DNA primase